jgi:hypothetical protein
LLKPKLLAQAQGFGHHHPFLPSAKLLALASRWPLLLAPTSRRSIPTRQFASASLSQAGPFYSFFKKTDSTQFQTPMAQEIAADPGQQPHMMTATTAKKKVLRRE